MRVVVDMVTGGCLLVGVFSFLSGEITVGSISETPTAFHILALTS